MRDYLALMKPTICLLVVITGAAGLVWERSLLDDPLRFAGVMLGLFFAAGSANAFNQYFERDIDAKMTRTAKKRPLPTGRISPAAALTFAVTIGIASTAFFGFAYNWLAATLSLGTIAYYAFFYTLYLKPTTPQNIVIGGAAGAMGPVIAWAAAANALSWPATIMFLIVFFWTPPHFWALALGLKEDYDKSALPMMPNVAGEDSTLRQMMAYSVVLVLTSLALLLYDAGTVYLALALLTGIVFMHRMWISYRDRTKKSYWMLFGYSIIYLFALFIAMMVDSLYHVPLPGFGEVR